ncbi:MAG: hypothetical protein H6992_11915 [Pseudomonadales bacterium]|nr:hypothetical protein [Pseudomonadales bacterium]
MTRYHRIILHAGLHKTGTTSVQENSARHSELLLQHGIVYPVFHFRERKIVNHSDPLAGVFSSRPQAYGMARRQGVEDNPQEAIATFAAQLEEILTQPRGQTLLLSAEMVADFNSADMRQLRNRLEDSCDELRVIVYVRSPESSLASILQQRALAGFAGKPQDLTDVVRNRFERIRGTFHDRLEAHNFHQAIHHPGGLLGHFFELCGLPPEAIEPLSFSYANSRISAEAYYLIKAINLAYPAGGERLHGVKRHYHDMRSLQALPGRTFFIDAGADPELATALAREGQWLEQELGWTFPPPATGGADAPWQLPTLLAVESAVSKLDDARLRHCATLALREEAAVLAADHAATATLLQFVAARLETLGECPPARALEGLGADYFKFAALQMERASPELAYYLMSLAGELRPDAPFIGERIRHYRDKLDGS